MGCSEEKLDWRNYAASLVDRDMLLAGSARFRKTMFSGDCVVTLQQELLDIATLGQALEMRLVKD